MKKWKVKPLEIIDVIAVDLTILAGVQIGLYGLIGFDLIGAIFGMFSLTTRFIFSIMGLSALYTLYLLIR